MRAQVADMPAFGEANLLNCERELIHLAGSIQPHGALLLVRESDGQIVQCSANAQRFLKLRAPLLNQSLRDIRGDLADRIWPHLSDPLGEITRCVRCHVGREAFDCLVHRPAGGGGLILELETAGPRGESSDRLEGALQAIMAAATLNMLCDEVTRIFKTLTGYDRVMVYRFDEEGHGEVLAEAKEPELEAFLGNRYPATDIPQIARRLYERNRIRLLYDVEYAPVPLIPTDSPLTGAPLDMSLCFLRSVSPIHVQYLKNMGVRGTLVISLMVNGRLWGLISCHHYKPRFLHFETRAVCELLAEAVATRIAALESFVQAQAEIAVRRLEQQLIRTITREGDWRNALFDRPGTLLEPMGASGAALLFEGEVRAVGDVPGTPSLRAIGEWLDAQPRTGLTATSALGRDAPQFASLKPVASGLLAVPVSTVPGEHLIWLRPERVRTVTWGGNPNEPHLIGDDPTTLSPRRSFAQWHQVVEGTADPWGPGELAAARLIGETTMDVVTQFRAVRSLIAEDQLLQVRRQLQGSGNAVVIAGPDGGILQINSAFEALLPPKIARPASIPELLRLFTGPPETQRQLAEVVADLRPWRGEVVLDAGTHMMPLWLRADPVKVPPSARLLGFVLIFTDLTERKAAEAARRRFQQSVIEQRRPMMGRLDSKADLDFRNILGVVVQNAQLAALEIADGVDPAQMPEMLEAIQASVSRTVERLGYLLWHATESDGSVNRD